MISRVFLVFYCAFSLGGAGLFVASRRQPPDVRRARLLKFAVYFLILHAVILSALAGRVVFTALVVLLAVLGARELAAAMGRIANLSFTAATAVCYLTVVVGSAQFAWRTAAPNVIFVYLIVCAFDGFSQVAGQLIGRRRLAPRLSPGKTIEGSLGGALAAAAIGLLLRSLLACSWPRTLSAVCLIGAASLAGDLLASVVKRKAGLKDFGALIPGHGGILDRFDSFLFAAACVFAMRMI